jgi:primosomal protein N' (replication factor Y) (superfamily II helicase)
VSETVPTIARVIVEIALDKEFDYLIPEEWRAHVRIGSQVMVPFGPRKITGYVVGLRDRSEHAQLKPILRTIGEHPLITESIVKLCRWMAAYYVCSLEQSVRTVLPSVVRRVQRAFKQVPYVMRVDGIDLPDVVERLRRRAPKQAAVLDALAQTPELPLPVLTAETGATLATVKALAKRGWVTMETRAVDRNPFTAYTVLPTAPLPLMPQQQEALAQIVTAMEADAPGVVLLFGVTGSGKTEVYLQALQNVLDRGQGAIVLVPEISLTPQTVERFRARFGDVVAVLHSHLSGGERHDEWHRIRDGRARIAIGARSALFAPVENLGLIVVDEEHEHSYKQEEAPRYNARDVAVVRGRMEKCAVVLGSATPALESIHNAGVGKYTMARMPARVDHRQMPMIRVVDMRVEMEREGRLNVLSRDLTEAIRARIERREQTILFLNRRGFATSLVCPKCGYVAECDQCSLAMTYHKSSHELRCHICGAARKVPDRCPEPTCQDPAFKYSGLGTQRVEEVVAAMFGKERVKRMDADTTTRKEAYGELLGAFRAGEIDILLGTQMIAKGLDFPNVTLVGVINADTALHMPDFRAGERTFQLITQVAGRAGRGDVAGEVIVQTFTPFHPAIQAARHLDYDRFFDQEAEYRKELIYPPYAHLVCLTLRGPQEPAVIRAGEAFMAQLQPHLDQHIVYGGPSPAPLARAKGEFRHQIIFRARRTQTITRPLRTVLSTFKWPRNVRYAIDVDALSLL